MQIAIAGIAFEINFQDGLSIRSGYLDEILDFCKSPNIQFPHPFSILITADPNALAWTPPEKELRPWNGTFYAHRNSELFFCIDTFACLIDLQQRRSVIVIDPHAEAKNIVTGIIDFCKLIVAYLVMERGGILLHCSAVCAKGQALAFAAASGGGKSTIAGLLAPQWSLLNDECNAILPEKNNFTIHATPFARPENLPRCHNAVVVLKKLYILEKAEANRSRPISLREGFGAILANMYLTATVEPVEQTMLKTVESIATALPVEILAFKNTPAIARDIHNFL